ncbi:ubiquinol-cytochrome C chaperone family protein [Qipengyuania sp. 6B39]|uniref:ubiquinol-cytochrome C chaperone family protein n=1 Tax=Qipengyuania proteolytica TaxID=2867239 RepID=UPI001C891320|nr:ubiquinol-cytochrome C chaperone family protein [Qipengyuania proteolytica]MBX7495149.1 ubiquinol-cytochrome C chaperone family protein [Qipengyuania proteolytica]
MSFFARLFGTGPDPREEWRALWHRTVEEARDPDWYRMCGVADSIEGRYDMITLVLALVMLRLENEPETGSNATARLTELFAEDMEGQLREAGIGDPTVGKKLAAVMASMNGRIGAYREGLRSDPQVLVDAVRRNVTMAQPDEAEALVQRMAALHARLERTTVDQLRAGEIAA